MAYNFLVKNTTRTVVIFGICCRNIVVYCNAETMLWWP